jgi:hypothetical protein
VTTTTGKPTKRPARIHFPDEQQGARWVEAHRAHLLAAMTRPQIHAVWEANHLGMKEEGNRARKADLAFSVAYHDWCTLGQEWWPAIVTDDDVADAETRVRAVGTPTLWADEMTSVHAAELRSLARQVEVTDPARAEKLRKFAAGADRLVAADPTQAPRVMLRYESTTTGRHFAASEHNAASVVHELAAGRMLSGPYPSTLVVVEDPEPTPAAEDLQAAAYAAGQAVTAARSAWIAQGTPESDATFMAAQREWNRAAEAAAEAPAPPAAADAPGVHPGACDCSTCYARLTAEVAAEVVEDQAREAPRVVLAAAREAQMPGQLRMTGGDRPWGEAAEASGALFEVV